ncbi:MAG: di-heme oxidoredictase family protein, partial [Polyangiales bacterium]
LHDMGADLADESGLENPREWRTPPLWGVGLSQTVQGYVSLLHDGRAASVLEAVLWHGGEAQAVRERVVALPADQRAALLRFVESL